MKALSALWNGRRRRRSRRYTAHYEHVLGTSLELQFMVDGSYSQRVGQEAEHAALEEIDRLERIFNAYSPTSEFRRWQSDYKTAPSMHTEGAQNRYPVSEDLAIVLETAETWRVNSMGAFHPCAEALTRFWSRRAERSHECSLDGLDHSEEDEAELSKLLSFLKMPLWHVLREEGNAFAERICPLPSTLNSIAKGYIIDAACRQAFLVTGVEEVLVNIGGDLRHMGRDPIGVAITDPFSGAENAPVASVAISNQGLATSGNYRRGFQVGDRWYSHLIDPRRGEPVEHMVSVSVLAPNAMLADILATVFSILSPSESLNMVDSMVDSQPDIGLLLISERGEHYTNAFWQDHSRSIRR